MAEQEQPTAGKSSWWARLNDAAATRLALVFGWVYTIWLFFLIPLIAPAFSPLVQAKIFYYASGWVQLFALPLMVYVSNKIQKTADAQSMAQAHLLERNTELTEQTARLTEAVQQLVQDNTALTLQVREAIAGPAGRRPPRGKT